MHTSYGAITTLCNCLKVAYHVFLIGLHVAAAAADGALEAISVHMRGSPPPKYF